jgi:hypothetical protein
MGFIWQRSRIVAIAVATPFGAAVIAVARPHPVSEPVLGMDWQCSRAAFVVTCNPRSFVPLGAPARPLTKGTIWLRSGSCPTSSWPMKTALLVRSIGLKAIASS